MKTSIQLINMNKSLFKTPDIVTSPNSIDFPLLYLGFHHFLHQSEGKLILKKEFEGKKQVFNVVNPYNLVIDDYDKDINTVSTTYFKKQMSSSSLSIWELLVDYKITASSFVAPKQLYDVVKTMFPKAKNTDSKAELVIFDNEPPAEVHTHLYEQTMTPVYLNNVSSLDKLLDKNGTCIMKISETFTKTSAKLLGLLTTLFKEVFVVKPFVSDPSTAQKYVVCIGFTPDKSIKFNVKESEYVVDIFTDIDIFNDTAFKPFIDSLLKVNSELLNSQFINMNQIVTFINEQNYRGDMYNKYRTLQINSTVNWIETYLK